MQAHPQAGMTPKAIDEMDERLDGMVKHPVLYDHELFEKAIEDPDVKEVKVFKLRHGQKLKVGDEIFKVYRLNKNITLKLVK